MKKYFMFAAVVTAGMLASCSSESLTGSDPKIETPDQADLVPIEIGVASSQTKAGTRGTGTAGDIVGGTNIWNGEQINVLMYQISDADETTAANGEKATFNPVTDGATPTPHNLYDETTLLVTPLTVENTASGIAKEIADGSPDPYTTPGTATYKVKYYPATGRSDFWGYYLGGYGTGANASAAMGALSNYTYDATNATITAAADADVATVKAIAFKIDGTHDLMVAKAATGGTHADGTFTGGQETKITNAGGNATIAKAASYSAKAARQGLQPELEFKHLLSRLTFKVKPGNEKADGIIVTGIKVHSMTDGQLIAAYKYDQFEAEPQRIIWNTPVMSATDPTAAAADYKEYPVLDLKQRTSATNRTMKELEEVELDWITAADIAVPTAHATEVHASTTGPQAYVSSVGDALLVAPQEKYYVEIAYKIPQHAARNWFADYANFDPANPDYNKLLPGAYADAAGNVVVPPIKATITRQDTNTNPSFVKGESYTVTITMWGPEEIEITTTLVPWVNSTDVISIDGE